MIVGLAGHVDHGKTSLIRALTGVDTDRLPEERARGMTIDLGFAYATAPDGTVVGFVDVPGHERFLSNMLAGVLGMDRVLLVVAADDGPRPQTHEHLEVLRLVRVASLAVVVTKIDRVPAARAAAVAAEMAALVARAGYAGAPVHCVSSVSGEGIAGVWAWILDAAPASRAGGAGFRMAIDRSFVLPGVGPVVTGTVAAGRVGVGDTLLLSPSRLTARVRSLRVQDREAGEARAGDRCALAVSGARIDRAKLHRGDWLVAPPLHAPSDLLDARVRRAEGRELRHGGGVQVHMGADAIPARLRVWDEGADEMFVRLQLARPVPVLHGDRLVLRDEGSGRVVAGGHVVDPFPPLRRRPRAERLAQLEALAQADAGAALAAVLASEGWADLPAFAVARNMDPVALEHLAAGLPAVVVGREGRRVAVSAPRRADVRARLLDMLGEFHAEHPDLPGMGRAALVGALGPDRAGVSEAMLGELLAEGRVVNLGLVLRLPEHVPVLRRADAALWPEVEALLGGGGLRPPRVREVAEAMGMDPVDTEDLLERFERFGRVMRVAANRFFLPATVAALGEAAAALDAAGDGFSAADFNRKTGIGRNLTIEVLEFLDDMGVTQRTGELRHVVRSVAEVVA
jgi:selenocysteine-specific elongation factor